MSNPITLDWTPLRIVRRKLGATQKTVGALVGVSGGLVSRWEHGSRQPSAAQLVGLAVGLGMPMYDLFTTRAAR